MTTAFQQAASWGFRVLALSGVLAASASARELTFSQAREVARQLAPVVQLAQGRSEVSNADVAVARALANPTLSLTTARQTAKLGTGVSVPLPLFGQRGVAIRAAKATADAVGLDVAVVRQEAAHAATLAWVDLWEAQERARFLKLASEDAERLFDIARQKFSAGTGAQVDVLRTRADRARAVADAEAVRLEVKAAAARLAPWIGADPSEDLVASGPPQYPPEGISLDELAKRLPDHPALQRDHAQVRAAEAHIKTEERLRWPLVNAQLTVNQRDPTLPGIDVIFGLSFELPVLSLRGGSIARARAERAVTETVRSADERRLRAEVLDSYRRTEGASQRLKAQREEVLPAIEQAKQMTDEGYRIGRIELIRVLEAQRALLDARLTEAGVHASWTRAVADLELAIGIDFQQGAK